jgi:hypothetical protein
MCSIATTTCATSALRFGWYCSTTTATSVSYWWPTNWNRYSCTTITTVAVCRINCYTNCTSPTTTTTCCISSLVWIGLTTIKTLTWNTCSYSSRRSRSAKTSCTTRTTIFTVLFYTTNLCTTTTTTGRGNGCKFRIRTITTFCWCWI